MCHISFILTAVGFSLRLSQQHHKVGEATIILKFEGYYKVVRYAMLVYT